MIQVTANIKQKVSVNAAIQRAQVNVYNVQPNGIAYKRPSNLYHPISYKLYDYGWHLANGSFDYVPPEYPEYNQELNDPAGNFFQLKHLNKFNTYDRFTDTSGQQNYTDGWIVDHLTGLEWCIGYFNSMTEKTWDYILTNNPTINYNGRTGRLCSLDEILTILKLNNGSQTLLYAPFNIDLSQGTYKDIITCNTNVTKTTHYVGIASYRTPVPGFIVNHLKDYEINKALYVRRIEKPLNEY